MLLVVTMMVVVGAFNDDDGDCGGVYGVLGVESEVADHSGRMRST